MYIRMHVCMDICTYVCIERSAEKTYENFKTRANIDSTVYVGHGFELSIVFSASRFCVSEEYHNSAPRSTPLLTNEEEGR